MTSHADYRLQLLVSHAWAAVVGPEVSVMTLVTTVIDGVVMVLVPSSAWVEQLEPRTAEFVEKLNHAFLSPGAITSIQWCEGVPATKGAEDAS